MTCELEPSTVHGYFDGELDAVRAAEFERHLDNCTHCRVSLEQLESLQGRFRQNKLYEHASAHLRDRIRKDLAFTAGDGDDLARSALRRWFLMPAFGVLAVAAAFWVALFLIQPHTQSARIAAEVIDLHVRSLQPGHLTDVQSTDQHTVKPWFDGKLDFVPPVTDYSKQGFPLVGGRLDVVDGHSVAALVYSRRKHFINLFVWPAQSTERLFDNSGSRQGYNWTMWRSSDMQFCLTSDVSAADLHEFKNLIDQ
jgi:anti-sigma factor RsiW